MLVWRIGCSSISRRVWTSCSTLCHCVRNYFVKSWSLFCLYTLEKVIVISKGCFLVFHDCVNFSDCEIDSFHKFIRITKTQPSFDIFDSFRFQIIGNFQIAQFFVSEDNKIFSCFWWLTKLISIRCLILSLSEFLLSFWCIETWGIDVKWLDGHCVHSSCTCYILKSFGSLNINNCFDNSKTLK